jgi:signal transduction histidine kinase
MTATAPSEAQSNREILVFLVVAMVLNPLLYGLTSAAFPDEYDPFWARALIALVSSGGVALYARPTTRRWSMPIAVLVLYAMQIWFTGLGYVNGTSASRMFNVLLMLGVGTVVLPSPRASLLFTVVSGATLALAYTGGVESDIPLPVALAVLAVMGATMGVLTLLRKELANRIEAQHRQTQQLAAEVERRKDAEARALQASRAKSAFLANMSHELRTPLNAIIGYTEIVQEGTDDDEARADLDRVLDSAKHLLTLINEVLDLARIEAGRLELHLEPIALDSLIRDVLTIIGPAAEARGLALQRTPTTERVHADRVRLKQILLNLLSNAVKFTSDGRVSVWVEPSAIGVRIVVADTGTGIAPGDLQRLFEAFERDTSSDNPTGTGLGLAIGRELAERMGGALTASSEVGVGSRFALDLPKP